MTINFFLFINFFVKYGEKDFIKFKKDFEFDFNNQKILIFKNEIFEIKYYKNDNYELDFFGRIL